MEIINSNTPGFGGLKKEPVIILGFNEKTINLSAGLVRKYRLKAGQFMHFVIDDDRLLFFLSDNTAGIKLFAKTRQDSLWGYLRATRRVLQDKMPLVRFDNAYSIKKLVTKINGYDTFQILTYKKLRDDKPNRDKRKNKKR